MKKKKGSAYVSVYQCLVWKVVRIWKLERFILQVYLPCFHEREGVHHNKLYPGRLT